MEIITSSRMFTGNISTKIAEDDRSVIEEGDLTLYCILEVVRKVLKTVDTNETMWDIVNSLLRISVA